MKDQEVINKVEFREMNSHMLHVMKISQTVNLELAWLSKSYQNIQLNQLTRNDAFEQMISVIAITNDVTELTHYTKRYR